MALSPPKSCSVDKWKSIVYLWLHIASGGVLGGELQQEMHLSPRTLIKRRDDGLDGLASMYSYLGQVKGGCGNT